MLPISNWTVLYPKFKISFCSSISKALLRLGEKSQSKAKSDFRRLTESWNFLASFKTFFRRCLRKPFLFFNSSLYINKMRFFSLYEIKTETIMTMTKIYIARTWIISTPLIHLNRGAPYFLTLVHVTRSHIFGTSKNAFVCLTIFPFTGFILILD